MSNRLGINKIAIYRIGAVSPLLKPMIQMLIDTTIPSTPIWSRGAVALRRITHSLIGNNTDGAMRINTYVAIVYSHDSISVFAQISLLSKGALFM
jgi:hypothetical protein